MRLSRTAMELAETTRARRIVDSREVNMVSKADYWCVQTRGPVRVAVCGLINANARGVRHEATLRSTICCEENEDGAVNRMHRWQVRSPETSLFPDLGRTEVRRASSYARGMFVVPCLLWKISPRLSDISLWSIMPKQMSDRTLMVVNWG